MITGTTFFGPSARHAMAAVSAESIPPERPTTTRSKPTLRTSSRTKPTRTVVTTLSSTAAVSAETVCLVIDDVMAFTPKQGVGDAGSAKRGEVEAVHGQLLVPSGRLAGEGGLRVDDARSAPEAESR